MLKNLMFLFSILVLVLAACRENSTDIQIPEIPLDQSGPVPEVLKNNVVLSGTFYSPSIDNRRRLNLSGIVINEIGIDLYGTNDPLQNIWLEIDGVNKGILVKRVSPSNRLKADIVFCVDVSGSMNEAIIDSIINTITIFDDFIYRKGIDARYGGVGFVGDIRGVKLLTDDVANFRSWMEAKRFVDTATQVLFPEFGSSHLSENPISAIRYADSLFNWRNDAQKVFIVFTDVPIKPSSRSEWSLNWIRDNLKGKGIIHTVFASDSSRYTNLWSTPNLTNQNPKELATLTGGTYKMLADGTKLHLLYLSVVESLIYSHSIDFITDSGKKNVKIVVTLSPNYDGKTELQVDFP